MYNPFLPDKAAAASTGPLTLATVGTVSEEGVTLILPGATEPTQAHYPNFSSSSLASGDSVIISRVSGTWVVMGKAGGGGGGGGGGTSNYNDLSNKPSINGNTLSGNKTAAQLGLGTYSKPSGGIPKSDLASAVQTSLGKADSALQSVPSTYRTAAAQDAIDAAQDSNLATIESSPATAAHAVGEYIVLNGQLYKVTAAIAAGQTLTPGTNISAVSGGGLNDLKRIVNYNPELIASGVTLLGRSLMSVYGEFFFFRAIIQVSTAQAQNDELFQLPNYNYDTTTTANVLVSRVDGGNGYTTVSIAANQTIRVVLPGGMATGRYEIILFGKCT